MTAKIRVPAEISGSGPRFVVFARGGAPADLPWANRISRRAREESWMKCDVETVLILRGALARKSVGQKAYPSVECCATRSAGNRVLRLLVPAHYPCARKLIYIKTNSRYMIVALRRRRDWRC
jgi:hypothetical protein